MKLQVVRLTPNAKIPTYAHASDAGMDLYAGEECTLLPGSTAQIKTGIAVAIPEGHVGLIWDKSGLSHRYKLKTLGGVIDSGYTGEVLVGMANLGDVPHSFAEGDKISQLLIQKVEHPDIEEVSSLEETERGGKGFGSTGI